jgi:DNA modification methylase
MADILNNSVDLILTDIPFGVVTRKDAGLRSLDKGIADIETFELESFLEQVIRICKGSIYIFCATEQAGIIRTTLDKTMSTRTCVWVKTNPSPMNGQHLWLSGIELCVYGKKRGAVFNEHCKNPVWRFPVVRNQLMPTQKPLALFKHLIEASSNEGDIVCDPCAGSGTAIVAALETNRRYIGIENNPDYYRIVIERVWGKT